MPTSVTKHLLPCTKRFTSPKQALQEAIYRAGSQQELANICGLRQQAVSFWIHKGAGAVPPEYLGVVSDAVLMTPSQLRPDLGWVMCNTLNPNAPK